MSPNFMTFCLLFWPMCALCQQNQGMTMVATHKLTISNQGQNLCPDSSDPSPSRIIRARSNLDCARKCKENPDCMYHSYHKDNGTCQHGLKGALPKSLTSSSDCQLMLDAEAFKGSFPKAKPSGTCDMPFQYNKVEFLQCAEINGSKCMNSGGELTDCIAPVGFTVAQEIVTLELNETKVPLPCISNWIILMYRYNGIVDFNPNWAGFKKGFGDLLTSEFWIGNDNIHLITNQPSVTYRLRIEMQVEESSNWYYAEYTPFTVDFESNGYMIHLSGFQGNAGDAMSGAGTSTNSNGKKFSTFDVENEPGGSSCAGEHVGGWWHGDDCPWSCLTCGYGYIFQWITITDDGSAYPYLLKAARMMVMAVA